MSQTVARSFYSNFSRIFVYCTTIYLFYHLKQRKKYWNCCKQEAYDWDDFMKIPPCCVGSHIPKYKDIK